MCYNRRQMLISNLPVRSFVGHPASELPRVAFLLALLIVVQPAVAEDAVATKHSASATNASPAANAINVAAPVQPATPLKAAATTKSPTLANVDQSITRLGSPDFRTREEALRQLMAAGSSAIEPLTKAAQAQDLEVSYRAMRVLQSLLEQEDLSTQQRAAGALESLSTGDNYATAELAADALALYHLTQQDRALECLRRLGATVSEIGFGDELQIVLDSQWHGKSADLALLKQAPRLNHLRILYVKIDDEALKTLAELTQLDFIELYGTGVSEESAAALAQSLPGVKIDRRNGAMLGVGPSLASIGCTIGTVVPGSAAMAADFRLDDEILSIDGHPVQRFEELTSLIGAKNVGDAVSIDLRRDGQIVTKQVTLGKWPN
jgi:hypothetical protein